jgi:HEAT repeat protein
LPVTFERTFGGDRFTLAIGEPILLEVIDRARAGELLVGFRSEWLVELMQAMPGRFALAALVAHTAEEPPPGRPYLQEMTRDYNLYAELFADPESLPFEEAARLARSMGGLEPMLDVKLALRLAHGSLVSTVASTEESSRRLLGVMEALDPNPRIWMILSQVVRAQSPEVRSRSAHVLVRATRNPRLAHRRLEDGDPAVRATVLEALWGAPVPGASDLFQAARQDDDPHVAASALVGLYLAGHREAPAALAQLAHSGIGAVRREAAWAMGNTRDVQFRDVLHRLTVDARFDVRVKAKAALAAIEQAPRTEQPPDPLEAERARHRQAWEQRRAARLRAAHTPARAEAPVAVVIRA